MTLPVMQSSMNIINQHPASPLLTGLLSYWKLDETVGYRLDSKGSRTLGPVNTVGYQTGKLGSCATFVTGAANYLSSSADTTLTNIDWSLGFSATGWIYIPTAYADRSSIITKSINISMDWALHIYAVDSIRFLVYDSVSGASIANDTTTLSADTWYFFTGRYNQSTKKAELKLNAGDTRLGSAITNVPKNSANQIFVNRFDASYGTAWIDSVGLWNRYLSDTEVTQIYNSGNGLEYPFLGDAAAEPTEWYDGSNWYIAP